MSPRKPTRRIIYDFRRYITLSPPRPCSSLSSLRSDFFSFSSIYHTSLISLVSDWLGEMYGPLQRLKQHHYSAGEENEHSLTERKKEMDSDGEGKMWGKVIAVSETWWETCPAEKRFNYLYYVLYYHNMYVSLRWWIRRRLEFKCFWRDFNLKIVYMPPQKISQYLLISCYFYKYQYHWLSLNWHIHISCFVQSAVEAQIMLLFLSSFAFVFSSLFCVLDLFHSFFSICHFPFYHFYLYWLINFLCSDISVVSSLTQTRLQSVQLDCLVFIL